MEKESDSFKINRYQAPNKAMLLKKPVIISRNRNDEICGTQTVSILKKTNTTRSIQTKKSVRFLLPESQRKNVDKSIPMTQTETARSFPHKHQNLNSLRSLPMTVNFVQRRERAMILNSLEPPKDRKNYRRRKMLELSYKSMTY